MSGPPDGRPLRRPPWWPDTEPWPPSGQWGRWGRRGRRPRPAAFGCFFLFFVVLLIAVVAVGVWVASVALGLVHAGPILRAAAIAVLLLGVLGVLGIARGVRRFRLPVAALIEAAGRIQEGDYSARVPEVGPRPLRSLARAFNSMSTRLEETDERRRSFLADVTHELRTPLTVIQDRLEAILDGVHPADPAHLAPILEETRTVQHLVEDLRTLALAETGSLSLVREPVDLAVLVNETVASYRGTADRVGVDLSAEVAPDVPVLDADPARVRSVLANLLTNAIRHTPAGGAVTVRVGRAGGDVTVAVADTGEGIAPDLLPRVFDRFVKGPGSRGTGLGMAIAKDLVTAHGGTIGAESEPGRGTTVRFTLPTDPGVGVMRRLHR